MDMSLAGPLAAPGPCCSASSRSCTICSASRCRRRKARWSSRAALKSDASARSLRQQSRGRSDPDCSQQPKSHPPPATHPNPISVSMRLLLMASGTDLNPIPMKAWRPDSGSSILSTKYLELSTTGSTTWQTRQAKGGERGGKWCRHCCAIPSGC